MNTSDQPQANQNEAVAAAQAAVMGINARGGIKGHPLVMDYCNNKFDPNQSVACARQAADGDYVAVTGGWYLPGDAGAVPIESAANIANVGMVPVALVDVQAPNWFPVEGGVYAGYPGIASLIKKYHPEVKKVAIASTDTSAATNSVNLTIQGIDFADLQYTSNVKIPFTATDYAPYAAALKSDGADAVIIVLSGEGGVALLKAMTQIGFTPLVSGPSSVYNSKDLAAVGPIATNGLWEGFTVPEGQKDNPGIARMYKELAAAEKSGVKDSSASEVTGYSINAWLGMQLFEKVANGIQGDVTRASVLEAMKNAKNVDLDGVVPAYSAPPGPDPAVPRVVNDQVYGYKLVNGEMQLVEPNEQPIRILQQGFRNQAG
ncbi:MAG TPA: ABC transporter substrate-binding protein [Acidimicrobiales bacterium]